MGSAASLVMLIEIHADHLSPGWEREEKSLRPQKSLRMLVFFPFGKTHIKGLVMDLFLIEYDILKAGLMTHEKSVRCFV